jgi:hypothetical protein
MSANPRPELPTDERALIAHVAELRAAYPELKVTTGLIHTDAQSVLVRAEIVLPSGAVSTGMAGAAADSPRAIETAENRALDRALAFLGVGTPTESTEPVEAAIPAVEPMPPMTLGPESEPMPPVPQPIDVAPPSIAKSESDVALPPPVVEVESILVAPESPRGARQPDPEPEPEVDLADYTWTNFWNWARTFGYHNKPQVEEVVGQSVTSLTPAQVRRLLKDKLGIAD